MTVTGSADLGITTVNHSVTIADEEVPAVEFDFTLASGTLTFAPGETIRNISVALNNDTIFENGIEAALISVSNPTGAILGADTIHMLVINDNDSVPLVTFAGSTSTAGEASCSWRFSFRNYLNTHHKRHDL